MSRSLALVLVLLAAGCHQARSDTPKHTDAINFSHDFHAKMDFDCDTCHKGITEAQDLSKDWRPREATCLECHEDKKSGGECNFCHTDPKHPQTYEALPALAVRFPHVRHKPPAAEKCTTCHTALPEPGKPARIAAGHDFCFSCHAAPHKQQYAAGRCDECHESMMRFAVAPVASFSHQGDFIRTHGDQARTSAETCAKCHDQTLCADCHAKTVAERIEVKFPDDVAHGFIHRGDYLSRHDLDARANPNTCARCHGTSFCDSCHKLNKLTSEVADPRNPHPAGWAFPGSVHFHGTAARNDINSCAACHDQGAASVCVSCHKVGGVGGNPHPASWLSRHDAKEISSNGMCAACH